MRQRIYIPNSARADGRTWNLGFKLLGTGVGVTLRSLTQAGAEGIVDLETICSTSRAKRAPWTACRLTKQRAPSLR